MGLLVKFGRNYSFHVRIGGPFVFFLVAMVAIPLADAAVGGEYCMLEESLYYISSILFYFIFIYF
jgi:hypothetical protein